MTYSDPAMAFKAMDDLNHHLSQLKLQLEGPIRTGGGFSYQGLLNGKMVTFNGFDEINYHADGGARYVPA